MRSILLFLAIFASSVLPAAAQQYQNSPVVCVRLPSLVTVLNQTVKETQLVPPMSTDVFQEQGDCTWTNRPFTADRQLAAMNGVFGAGNLGGFVGWIVTDRWLIPLEQIAFLDKAKEKAWRPAAILNRNRWTLSQECWEHTQTQGGITIYGHQFDPFGRNWCSQPMLKSN